MIQVENEKRSLLILGSLPFRMDDSEDAQHSIKRLTLPSQSMEEWLWSTITRKDFLMGVDPDSCFEGQREGLKDRIQLAIANFLTAETDHLAGQFSKNMTDVDRDCLRGNVEEAVSVRSELDRFRRLALNLDPKGHSDESDEAIETLRQSAEASSQWATGQESEQEIREEISSRMFREARRDY